MRTRDGYVQRFISYIPSSRPWREKRRGSEVRTTAGTAHNRRRLPEHPRTLFQERRQTIFDQLAGQLRHLVNRQPSVRKQPPAIQREEPTEPIGKKHLQLIVRDILTHEPPVHTLTHERTCKMLQEQLGRHVLAVALPQQEVLAQMLGEGREEGAQGTRSTLSSSSVTTSSAIASSNPSTEPKCW